MKKTQSAFWSMIWREQIAVVMALEVGEKPVSGGSTELPLPLPLYTNTCKHTHKHTLLGQQQNINLFSGYVTRAHVGSHTLLHAAFLQRLWGPTGSLH